MNRIYFQLLILILFSGRIQAAVVSGHITDETGVALPFVSVYLEGTSTGTTSNTDGYYKLNTASGTFRIVFRMIGYKQVVHEVMLTDLKTLDVQLFPEAYHLKEVKVSAAAEDPAYAIIRQAQKKRKFYLGQVKEFSCDAYTKSLQRMDSYPKKILGQEVDLSEQLDSTSKILYLSEAVSKLAFRYPDKVKEEMISSKVSGSNRSFSFNQAAGLLFNFYENLLELGGISQRGFVSPIASNAMLFYDYRLEGTYIQNGVSINKIKVIPKRKHDPVFRGEIYIQDDTWRIHSADLLITKDAQIEFVDSIRFNQTYIAVTPEVWMPFSAQVDFVFGFMGFKGRGYFLGISSNYNVNPGFGKKYFDGEILKINQEANKKDSVYWDRVRQVPLTLEENRDYIKRDSTRVIRESKPFRDSVDKKNNKFKPGALLLGGYSYNQSYLKRSFSVSPLIQNIQFNTVEGLNLGVALGYRKGDEDDEGKSSSAVAKIRYGFSNQHFNGYAGYRKRYNPLRLASYSFYAGTDVVQFNADEPISELINSSYTLLAEQNFMKIYEKRFLKAGHQSELVNGLNLALEAEWSQRLPLSNTTDYTWVDKDQRVYTSNDPVNPIDDANHFKKHEAFTIQARLTILPGQEYMTRPNGKYVTGTNWPEFEVDFISAIPDFAGSDLRYDKFELSGSKNFDLRLFGNTDVKLLYGDFLQDKTVEFMDYLHFNGNQTIFSSFKQDAFSLLDYYQYSTTGAYFAGHLEHNFGGFILNKIPLLRKLKFNEVIGIHYLHTDLLNSYTELSFGIEKLGIFRIDFVTSFEQGKKSGFGVVLGIKGL